ncbi:hypothetical protein NON00_08460 [Roseomonas sp. GC11]|uniref:hypothetical protein n=1 Tax=Roseomonas sp. GC11 TaxID=2950546 RepID=UPI00210B7DFE|nr:hypothetical protein [Roseomonas sp. GC11]MCQ4159961.1 hypothetical protein [Roseomonas sp. GC11]
MSTPRQARLDLDAALRQPLPRAEAEALVALLMGRAPRPAPAHPLFRHPDAELLLTGESLDHATAGSRIVQEEEAPRLAISSSLPPQPQLLGHALDWLGGLVKGEPGELLGFVVPPGSHRHDMRLLAWDGARLCPLGPVPKPETLLEEGCSMAAFQRAAGLPDPEAPEAVLAPAMRRVVLAQLGRRALPVAQRLLDGRFDGQALFRAWLAAAAARRHGFTTACTPLSLTLA